MLSKKFRLKRGRIEYLLKKGDERITRLFIVKYKSNRAQNPCFSVLISRKIFPKAVNRNRLRRQISEAIRLNLGLIENAKKDILLIPKKHIIDLKYQEIGKGVQEMLKSLK